jgi:hypothetical protein
MRQSIRGLSPVLLALCGAAPNGVLAQVDSDFNGDFISDIPVGIPSEMINGNQAGAVAIFYGSNSGLQAGDDQLWHLDVPGIGDDAEHGDEFGFALVSGYFNGDEFCDLAVGIPGGNVGAKEHAGAVLILYGSANGLATTGSKIWHLGNLNIDGVGPEDDGRFGEAVIAADYNNDGIDELVVGAPGFDVGGNIVDAGAVFVLQGSTNGIIRQGAQAWSQDSLGIEDEAEPDDRFGSVLVEGGFDEDDFNDLAIGVPNEDVGNLENAGVVHIIYGRASGLHRNRNQLISQDFPGVADVAEEDDRFGSALASDDFNVDGIADLAIGVPFEEHGGFISAGLVHVLYGSNQGLTGTGDQVLSQKGNDTEDDLENFDRFGSSLADGDFDSDGVDDLAIGVPGEDVDGRDRAGGVHIFRGSIAGMTSDGDQFWTLPSSGLGVAKADDEFGFAVGDGDFDQDGYKDLVVGIPFRKIGITDETGAMAVLYGSFNGLEAAGAQLWTQNSRSVQDTCEIFEHFGSSFDQ